MRIEEWCRSRLGEFLLFVLAVSLFALSHPNPLLPRGCALLAYGALAPLFLLVRWASGFAVVFWGVRTARSATVRFLIGFLYFIQWRCA